MSRQPSVVFSHPLIKNFIVIASFLLLAFAIRYPDFFYYQIDWDESSYILLGQDVVNGHLPLTQHFAIKPPLLPLPYALTILLFGKSIVAIRLLGLFCIVSVAFVLWRIGKEKFGETAGFWAGSFHVLASSVFVAGQATMSEHIASVPLAFVILILLMRPNQHLFWIGVLLGVTTLMRTNLVYVGFMTGLIVFFSGFKDGWTRSLKRTVVLFLGGVAPMVLVGIVYAAGHQLALLKKLMWDATLSYTAGGNTSAIFGINPDAFERFFYLLYASIFSYQLIYWFAPFLGFLLVYLRRDSTREQKRVMTINALLFLAVLASIMHSGWGYPHYLIQLIPMMSLMVGAGFAARFRPTFRYLLLVFCLVGFLITLKPLIFKYHFLYLQKKDVSHTIVDYLSRYDLSGRYVYFATDHIGYWFTGAKIPMQYIHPTAIASEYLYKIISGENATTKSLIHGIFLNRPLFIIMTSPLTYLDEEHNKVLNEEISRNYVIEKSGLGVLIYRRKDLQVWSTKWWRILQDQAKSSAVERMIEVLKSKSQVIVSRPPEFYVENVDLFLRQHPESLLDVVGIIEMLAQNVNDYQPARTGSL